MKTWPTGVSVLAALAGSLAVALAASAQQPIPAEGRNFALQVCAPCHLVTEGQAGSEYAFAPDFREIANRPGMSERALFVILYSPHEIMPNLRLSPDEAELVIDYILSLRER